MRTCIAAAALLCLAGCATPGRDLLAEAVRALAATPVCCSSLATARRVPLPVEAADLVIDQTSQAFDFGGNKAFFALYELPGYQQSYSILLTSMPTGTLQDIALLIPRVATYDEQFKVVRFFDEKTLRNRGNSLERTVFINPQDRHERYIAVYGSDLSASLERAYSIVTVTPVMVGGATFNFYSGADGKSTLRSSPAGRLKIEVKGFERAAVK